MPSPETQFLHQRNPSLHSSREVEDVTNYLRAAGDSIPNDPADKLAAHLGFLANADYVNDGILTGDQSSIDRQVAAKIILEPSEIPEGYFDLQRRIAREEGHGDIAITDELRKAEARVISGNQAHSLKAWADYISSDDAAYPNWFKLYAFDGISRLGKFDKDKGEFLKRSNGTTVPYPEVSRGALSQLHSWISKSLIGEAATDDKGDPLKDGSGKQVIDKTVVGMHGNPETDTYDPNQEAKFQKALKAGRFDQLYVYALEAVNEGTITAEQKKEVEGQWKVYKQNSDPKQLHGDLQGFGLDWCTATGFETTKTHLAGGDFYVYYSKDLDGKDTVPRVAIRMQEGTVAEVRGINTAQELEPEMADITLERLKDLPGGEAYTQKAKGMKRLTAIDKRIAADPNTELTDEDIRFLYEMDREIEGFGYGRDPRIREIKAKRGRQDKPELTRLLPEIIREQSIVAFEAYKEVSRQLGTEMISPADFEKIFTLNDKEWHENGVYNYLIEELITKGNRYNLVATPNEEADEKQIVALAEAFGKDQPHETYVSDEIYRKSRYSNRQWSGADGTDGVRLSLIPSRPDAVMRGNTVETQLWMLKNLQSSEPRINFRVPSLLDAVAYWYTLRAQGDRLMDTGAFNRTYIRQFDLELTTVGGTTIAPCYYVDDRGMPCLDDSLADAVNDARLAVG